MLYVPAVLSCLVLAAHFLRWGNLLGGLACLALPAVALLSRQRWALRAWQVLLAAGTLVWLTTAVTLGSERISAGQPYLRMTLILGAVAALSAVSAWLLSRPSVAGRYR